jgi:hypothetical protein
VNQLLTLFAAGTVWMYVQGGATDYGTFMPQRSSYQGNQGSFFSFGTFGTMS